MKKLLVFLHNYIVESILGPLFKLLEACFELLVPIIVASVIDNGITKQDSGYIYKWTFIMMLLGAVGLICSITAQYFAAKAATGFGGELRKELFLKIHKFSFGDIDEIGTSKLITRMTNDVNTVQSTFNMVLRLLLRAPFIVVGAMLMSFTIDTKSALIFVFTIVALSIVVFGIMIISIPLYKKIQVQVDKILKHTRENLKGVRVIRSFNQEQDEIMDYNLQTEMLNKFQMFAGRISSLMNPITFVIINLAMVVLIHTGAIQVDNGILTQGQLVALVNYMSQILVELIKLASLIIQITRAMASVDRISQVITLQTEMQYPIMSEKHGNTEYAIEFEQVGLLYRNSSEEILSDINIRIKKGETIGVIGGTGSGKTSFVHLIPRYYDVNRGSVKVEGINVKEYTKLELRKKIGVVMQKASLVQGTIRENLTWGNEDATEEQLLEVLAQAQALDFVKAKKGNLDYKILQGGTNLSGGQKQRLSIARALLMNPEILILDDSSSALDYTTDSKLRKEIMKSRQGLTTIIVSQRATTLMNTDRILVLDDGQMVGLGTHGELIAHCEVYQEICKAGGIL